MPAYHDQRSYLLAAQLNELSMRERVSSAASIVAVLTVAWVHFAVVDQVRILGWVIGMCLLQALRIVIARSSVDADESYAALKLRRAVHVGISVVNGLGWGCIWFLLDSGRLDFIFMFKFGTLAAALGVTVNVLGVVLSSYVAFASSLILLTIGYLIADASVLTAEQRFALLTGVVAYYTILMVVARNTCQLTRVALEQGMEREVALAESQASHRREQKLRERLEQESKELENANLRLNEAHDRLLVIARRDALTGIPNRRHLVDELERAVHGYRRYGIDFSLFLLDVDHFKQVNDTFGHQVGDLVLKGLSVQVLAALRDIDVFGRWGGEEFLCLLPNTTYEEALLCAERLCIDLANARLVEAMPDLVVTASFGVVGCCGDDDVNSVMSRVDAALYEAKAGGRNRVSGLSCFD
ncbi:MAG: diguanylate cyclase [Propionivibrio sp.]